MRGLVLSGGGANGAFEVGAIRHIIGERRIHYDVICGVSVGALNGAVLAQYPEGGEEYAAAHLSSVWDQVNENSDIYRKWYHGWFWHLPVLWHRSIYCTAPLQKIVNKHLETHRLRLSKKKFRVGAVCWNNGKYRIWEEDNIHIKKAVLASSAFPIFFESVEMDYMWYTDGGLRDITPIKAAIDAGCKRIDVIQCAVDYSDLVVGNPGLLKKLQISLGVTLDEIDRNDYEKAQMINLLVKAGVSDKKLIELHRVRPTASLGDSLDFSKEKRERNEALGYQAARAYPEWGK